MKFRIRHAAVPAALLSLGLLATACGGSTGTAASSPTTTAPHSSPASGSASTAPSAVGPTQHSPSSLTTCTAAQATQAVRQAQPVEQTLTGRGYKLDSAYPYGTAYNAQFKLCGWKGYYTNGTLVALVGLGAVEAMGTTGHWVISPVGTSVANQITYTQQALQATQAWAGLYSGGPADALKRSAAFTVNTMDGPVGVTLVASA